MGRSYVTVGIEDDLNQKARLYAVLHKKKLREVYEEAIALYLNKVEKEGKSK